VKNVVAVDVGFGRVKALSAERQLEFPSVVGPWRAIRFKNEVASSSFLEQLAVEYVGQKMFLGEMAYRQSKARMNMSMDRFYSVEGMALMLTAVAMLGSGRDLSCHLVTGLPVNAYAAQKEKYKRSLLGQHYIKLLGTNGTHEDRYITIAECKVLPQSIGTVFNLVLGDTGQLANKELAASRLAVLDVGANTLDLCRVDSLEFIDRESTSFGDLGVFECYRQLSLEIYNAFGIEIPPEEIEPYIANGVVKIGGRPHGIAEIKNKVYQDAAEKIVSRVRNVWRNMWQFDKIIVAGGGAAVFGEQIAKAFNSPGQVEVSRQGTFSNTLGYLKFGYRVWPK
jgi:plasmid segregation protein ParM